MDIFLLLLRLTLAAIFGLAGIAKFLDLKGSEKAFKEFGVPDVLAKPSSMALSVFEIVIAVLFLSVETSWFAALGASALLLLFIGQMIYQMAKGNTPDCHCFGQIHSAPVGKLSIARNIGFAAISVFLVTRGSMGQGLGLADPRLDVMQLAFGVVFVGILAAVLSYLKKISEQQTQIMRRIELIELVGGDGGAVERDDAGHPHEGLPIGAVFPDFHLPDLNGDTVSLEEVAIGKTHVLFFFISPSCNPCKALVPEFEQWQDELANKVKLVFVSSGKADDNLAKFGGDASKQILIQSERELAELVKAQWTPTAVLMDANGRIASHVAAGDTAIRDLVDRIKSVDINGEFTYFSNDNGHSHTNNKIGSSIPDFSLSDIKGVEINSDYFKGKQTLVAFWSLTCPHCVNMMEDLREWDKTRTKDDPALVMFSDGDKASHEQFGLVSPIILDEGHKTAAGFGMFGTPSAVLVNGQGKIMSETAVGAPNIWSLIGKRK